VQVIIISLFLNVHESADVPVLTCCYRLNVQSVVNKLRELHYMLYAVKPLLLFIAESWLNMNTPTGCLDPESCFHVLRCDRKACRGGGMCVFVHKSLQAVQIYVTDNYKELELLCFDLLCSSKKLCFFCAYRPPSIDRNAHLHLDL